MTGFDAWRIATTIKMHFEQEKFDAIRFNFKARNLTPRVYESRRERYFFEKIANKLRNEEEVKRYTFANILFRNDFSWTGNMLDEPYVEYLKRVQGFGYRFKSDLAKFTQRSLDSLLVPVNGNIPTLVKSYLEGNVMMESVIAVNAMTGFVDRVSRKVADTMLWPEVRLKLSKATPFIGKDIDLVKAKRILVEHFSGLQNPIDKI